MRQKFLYILLVLLGFATSVNGQLNDYKYVIVPKKLGAFPSENMHLTSTMMKYYFAENGFNAIYDDEYPIDLVQNPCLGLTSDLLDYSSMIATKIAIVLKDCRGNEVFRTMEGRSKEKEFRSSYKDAIKKSFVSFEEIDYAYVPKEKTEMPSENTKTIKVSFKDDVKSVDNLQNTKVVEQKATPEEQLYKSREPAISNITKAEAPEKTTVKEEQPSQAKTEEKKLIAQKAPNGYRILDNSLNVVLTLQETSLKDVFLTEYRGFQALVFKKGDDWILEYTESGKRYQEELNILF